MTRAPRHTLIALALGGGCLAACDSPCPGVELTRRPPSGNPVEGTAFTCDGAIFSTWLACGSTDVSHRMQTAPPPSCDATRIMLGSAPLVGPMPVIALCSDGASETARLEIQIQSDDGPLNYAPPTLVDGYVQPELVSSDGRNTGRFELQFEGGTMAGQYDTGGP